MLYAMSKHLKEYFLKIISQVALMSQYKIIQQTENVLK